MFYRWISTLDDGADTPTKDGKEPAAKSVRKIIADIERGENDYNQLFVRMCR